MAKGKIGNLFSGRDGRRDWDEVEEDEEFEEDDPEEEDDGEERGGLFSSVSGLFRSRRSGEDETDEEEEEEDDGDDVPRRSGLRGLLSRRKSRREEEDYDFDDTDEPAPAKTQELSEPETDYAAYADEGFADEDYVPREYAEEEYAADYLSTEPDGAYEPEDYDPADYAPEEQAFEPEELFDGTQEENGAEEFDPFAALAYRAANPEADYAAGEQASEADAYNPEEYADYGEEAYADEYAEDYADEYDEEYADEYADDYGDEPYDDFEEEEAPRRGARTSRSSRGGGLTKMLLPALAVLSLCALAAIAFAVVTLLGSSAGRKKPNAAPVPAVTAAPAAEETADPTAGLTPAEIQAQGLATPDPAETTVSVKATRDADGRLVPYVGGAVVPNRGTKLSVDDFSHAAMIGNSFVEGMNLWSDINSMRYICADGVSLDNMIGNYLYYVTVQNYDSIYLCLGLNEIGWSADTFISKYEKVIDYIRSDGTAKTRNATIYIVSVMPVEKVMETTPAESGSTISKATIVEFNERLKTMCQEKGCWYLDVYSALADNEGYLPDSIAAADHVHFEKTGYSIWTNYLQTHYVDDALVGE
ncbi:MAG: GDSL-type esterase/lipase family protein [Oscillospiraceae bacterium]|nr:GDSL-type esterase/lipase family protein [Oscillospiraceae bacterium]